MPKGTHVEKVYEALKGRGYDKGKAARIAQSQTGEALSTGKPIKKERQLSLNDRIVHQFREKRVADDFQAEEGVR